MLRRLLVWLHLRRPRQRSGVRVVDMNEVITELDVDTSMFTTMLMRLPRRYEGHQLDPYYHEDTEEEWGFGTWSNLSPEAEEALRAMTVRKFQDDGYEQTPPTYSWTEDEFMPRLASLA